MKFPMPHILGSDVAGEVVEVGELCERVKVGWRVLLSPGQSCRQCEQCLLGNDNFCRRFTMLGYAVDGGNTELLAVSEYGPSALVRFERCSGTVGTVSGSGMPPNALAQLQAIGSNMRLACSNPLASR